MAILLVVMVHCGEFGANHYPVLIWSTITNASHGVQLFYIASAFTLFLTFRYHSAKEHSPNRNFFIRRFFRIAPMYYIAIIYFLFQAGRGPNYWLGDATHISDANILSNFLFVFGFNPYWINSVVPGGWSVAVEVLFYCSVPFLFRKIKNLNQALIFTNITLLLKAVLHIFFCKYPLISYHRLWLEYLDLYLPAQLPVFSFGIILYFLYITPKNEWLLSPYSILCFALLFMAQLGLGINFIFPIYVQFGIGFTFLAYVLSKKSIAIIVNPFTEYLGKISYSIYLIHFGVLYWLTRLGFIDLLPVDTTWLSITNYLLRLLLVLVICSGIGTVTYHLIEQPFIKMGKKLITKLEKQG